ncbi:MAG: hypothetical protein E7283_09085 [Lachnospiraceae bacterium]|nr:hypothetical protein [Lachnospiraceae bacterium]
MGTQDNIEKVLRSLHVLLSKSEPYGREPSKVVVDKQQMLDLLSQLNKSVYDIMDEYELTKQSRDRAEREFRKRGDEIIWDASRKAEDIYAASVMYTDEALGRVQDIMKESNESLKKIYENVDKNLKEQEEMLRKNQLELKSQLQDLVDTEKYLKLIEERNKEIKKEKEKGKPLEEREASIYANRQTEIKINQQYFEKMGIPVDEQVEESSEKNTVKDVEEKTAAEVMLELDADYFNWKEQQEEEKKPEGLYGVLKNLTSPKK